MTEGPTTARAYNNPQNPEVVTQNPPRYESPQKYSSPRVVTTSHPPITYHSPHRTYVANTQASPPRVVQVGAP